MKIFAIQGSPRATGATQRILDRLLAGAAAAGHEHETIRVYDLDLNGCIACMACSNGRVDVCTQDDDFLPLYDRIAAADLIVFATPVYFGQMSGPLKTFLDRFYTFCLSGFEIRELKGKRFVTIVTSGAPEAQFCKGLAAYFEEWLGGFFHMQSAGSLLCGELGENDDILGRQDVLNRAEKLGREL